MVTNAGGGASFWRDRAVTRHREDPTSDYGSQFLYLRDVRSGAVWSAAYHPTGREADDYLVTFQAERAVFRRRDDEITTQLDIAVSTEDDVEVRRLSVTNHSDRPCELEITSYGEIALSLGAGRSGPSRLQQAVRANRIHSGIARPRFAAAARARRMSPGPGPFMC